EVVHESNVDLVAVYWIRCWRSFNYVMRHVCHWIRGSVQHHAGGGRDLLAQPERRRRSGRKIRIGGVKTHFRCQGTYNQLKYRNCLAMREKGTNSKVGVDPVNLRGVQRSIGIASDVPKGNSLCNEGQSNRLAAGPCSSQCLKADQTQIGCHFV